MSTIKTIKSILAITAMAVIPISLLAQNEHPDRGLVVAKGQTDGHYFASWRMLDSDPSDVSFTLLKDGKPYKENIKDATSIAVEGLPTTKWQIIAERNHNSQLSILNPQSKEVLPWAEPYLKLRVSPPASYQDEDGNTISYTANDCSVGDVDGDGQYELILKWSPNNEKDNSHYGRTGKVFISCYKLDMEAPQNAPRCLWTIDLGNNIRAGAHYTQFMVADFDGDGRAEMMCKTAPGSKDGKGNYVNLAATDKEILSVDNSKDWRNDFGSINGGQEYLTVFDGQDGHAINTVFYEPNRNTGVGGDAKGTFDWNTADTGKDRIDDGRYGNRGERYLACVAYLDGIDNNPDAVFCRGYYTYAFAWAVSFDGKEIHTKWLHESRDGKQFAVTDGNGDKKTFAAGVPTSGSGSGTLYNNGNHNLCVADVDNDGKDEVIWGSAALDDDGKVIYATGFGHGDAVHLADLVPNRPGYEVFDVHEQKGKYCWDVHDARTGEILLKGGPEGVDNGRGLTAQIVKTADGSYQFWSADAPEIRDAATGDIVSKTRASINFRIYWDGDLMDELLDGVNVQKWTPEGTQVLGILGRVPNENIQKDVPQSFREKRPGKGKRFGFMRPSVSFNGYGNPASNNWTKNNPCLQCDLFGDWREEVIYRDANDPSVLYVYMSQIPTTHRLPTLMQDHVYRMGIAWQNVAYNQPPYKGKKVKE